MNLVSNQKRYLRAAAFFTTAYLCVVFFVHPLIFTHYYFNITETKQAFFLISSGGYLLLLLFARIVFPPDFGVARVRVFPHPAAVALAMLFVVSVAGALFSRYPSEALLGQNNRYQGLLTLLSYALIALALSRRTVDLAWPERALVLSAVLVSLLGLLNHFGVDPFGFYENLRAADRGRFLSTLGNADFYGSYIVMAFAVTLGFFLRANSLRLRVLTGLALVSVSFGALVAGSDSTALGLIACGVVFPLLLFSDPAAMRRLMLGWGVFFLCAFVFGQLSMRLPSATYLSYFTGALSRATVSLPLAAVSFALRFAIRPAHAERLAHNRRRYGLALGLCALFLALVLVLFNTVLRDLPLGRLEHYLRFNESWGTDRGRIWAFVTRFYSSLPVVQKFLGAGPGALLHADAVHPLFSDASLDTAHNEYLQYLIINGALGLGCYLAALALAIRAGVHGCVKTPVLRGFVIAAVAYAAQAAVNIAQPASTPLFFLILSLLVSRPPEVDPPDEAARQTAGS